MATKQTSELKDLDVDRVDGVDRPATGRSFLLFKGEDSDTILKGYGMVATAAAAVLAKMRTDKNAVVSKSSAVALNGLAQVLGQEAVFVGKSVPTQPYVCTEDPDVDTRGPADEKLGSNFVARNASMVNSVKLTAKDEDADDDASKAATAKSAAKAAADKAAKAKAGDDEPDEDDMPAGDKKNRGVAAAKGADVDVAAAIVAMTKAIADLPAAIVKAEKAEIAKMQGEQGDEQDGDAQPVRKAKSRQIVDDEPVSVRKGAGAYEPRFGVSFKETVFGK